MIEKTVDMQKQLQEQIKEQEKLLQKNKEHSVSNKERVEHDSRYVYISPRLNQSSSQRGIDPPIGDGQSVDGTPPNSSQAGQSQPQTQNAGLTDTQSDKREFAKLLSEAIKIELVTKDIHIKRDYKLSQKSRFETFYEFFTSELRTIDLLYVIDKSISAPNLSKEKLEKNASKVRDILINRIDEVYQSKILQIKDPFEVLQTLKTLKTCENNLTSQTIRRQLHTLQYEPGKESAMQFLDRFEEIVRNFECLPGEIRMGEVEKSDALYGAVKNQIPTIKNADYLKRSDTGKGLTYEKLRNMIIQDEADRNEEKMKVDSDQTTKSGTVASASFATSKSCHHCGETGHLRMDCPKKNSGLWKCYECLEMTSHKAADCPLRQAKLAMGLRGRGRGRGGRGRFGNRNLNPRSVRSFKPNRGKFNKYNQENRQNNWQNQNGNFVDGYQNSNNRSWRGKRGHKKRSNRTGVSSTPNANLAESQPDAQGGQGMCSTHKEISCHGSLLVGTSQTNETIENNVEANLIIFKRNSNLKFGTGLDTDSNSKQNLYVTFIVDSGATEHLTNSEKIFATFDKTGVNVIKCANKDSKANLIAEGRGSVNLTAFPNKETFQLNNVVYSKSLSENLLSLRHFAEAGYTIQLDNKIVEIFDPKTNQTLASGVYEKPYWLIEFQVNKEHTSTVNAKGGELSVFDTEVEIDNEVEKKEENNEENNSSQTSDPVVAENKTNLPRTSETQTETVNEDLNTKANEENSASNIPISKELLTSRFDTTITDRRITNLDDLPTVDLLDIESPFSKNYSDFVKTNKAMLWHVRMGHASLNYLKQLQVLWKDNKDLQNVVFDKSIQDCEVCSVTKLQKLPFKGERNRATRPLQIIHSDVMGKIKPVTHPTGYQWISVFVDDYSRLALAYPMKTKDETGYCLEKFIKSARNLLGKDEKVCFLRSDQGTEYTGGYTQVVMMRENIEHSLACPDTPQHNGVSERFNQTIQKRIRALMFDSKLPHNMWDLALNASVYVYNRTPHKGINFETPLSKFAPDFHFDINQIKRFGCLAYWTVARKPDSKFSARAIRGVLVGYSPSGFLFLNPESGKFFESRNVKFNEKLVFGDKYSRDSIKYWSFPSEGVNQQEWFLKFEQQKENDESSKTEGEIKRKRGRPRKSETEGVETKKRKEEIQSNYNTRSRQIKDTSFSNYANSKLNDFEFLPVEDEFEQTKDSKSDFLLHSFFANLNEDPRNFEEAMESEEKDNWSKAVKEELESMKKNEVWTLVDRPIDKDGNKINVIDSKWVFKKKINTDGSKKCKARLVIRGFKDTNAYDLKETYAPVSRLTLVRAILAIINRFDLDVCQLDVKTAFLNGTIEGDIFMEIPDGVEVSDEVRKTKVCKLHKALYGLRISPKRWNEKFAEVAKSIGLINDDFDPCLFTWKSGNSVVILLLYVDDMLLASNDKVKLAEVKTKLMSSFEMTDLGEPQNFLGMEIARNRISKTLKITQTKYTDNIIKRFGFDELYPQNTPMVTRQISNRERRQRENSENDDIAESETVFPYREAIGSLLYLAGATRPDIAFAVNVLSRHQLNPTIFEWNMVKRVFRYLKGTSTLGLHYTSKRNDMVAYSDASFADCKNSISTCGYVVSLFGDTIAWRTTKQSYVSLSTCQAEYVAMSLACQEVISINKSISRVLNESFLPALLRCDNNAAIACAKTSGGNRLRHMVEVHDNYVKECVKHNRIIIEWVSTKEQWADIMTKPLSFDVHVKLRNKLLNYE